MPSPRHLEKKLKGTYARENQRRVQKNKRCLKWKVGTNYIEEFFTYSTEYVTYLYHNCTYIMYIYINGNKQNIAS